MINIYKLRRDKCYFLTGSLALFIILQLAYIYYIYPAFSPFVNYLFEINIIFPKIIISVIFLLLIGAFVPINNTPISFLLIISWISIILPTFSLYGVIDGNDTCFLSYAISFMVMICSSFLGEKISIKPKKTIITERYIDNILKFLIFFSLFVCFIIVLKGGLKYFDLNLNFKKIYFTREKIMLDSQLNNALVNYLTVWAVKIILPAGIILSLSQKKIIKFLYFVSVQVFIYFIFFQKAYLFIPVFCIIIYYFFQKSKKYYMILNLTIIFNFSLFLLSFTKLKILSAIFLRRLFFVPAINNYLYFEFFKDKPLDMMRSNLPFRLFFESPYKEGFQVCIGRFMHEQYSHMNNGFIATGYVHFGFFGSVLFAIIVGIIVGYISKSIKKNYDKKIVLSIVTIPFLTLFTSTDFLTGVLSHGILIAIIFSYFLTVKEKGFSRFGFKIS